MNNQNVLKGIIVVLALLLVICFITRSKNSTSENSNSGKISAVKNNNDTPSSSKAAADRSLSRAGALVKYQDKVVRITDECSVKPFTYTFNLEEGTVVMIDNDADTSNTIILPKRTLTLPAHHFTLETIDVTGYVSSTCDPKTHITTVIVK